MPGGRLSDYRGVSQLTGGATMPAPLLGQHNDAVYGSLLGLPPGEINSLRKQGAI